jgi:membrane fusion protein (multidrug efflux system)
MRLHPLRSRHSLYWAVLGGAVALTLVACEKPAPPPPPPPPEVKAITIKPRDTAVTFEYIGHSQSPQQVNIVARVSGFLDRQIHTERASVKSGQVLFQMDRKPFQA